MDDSESDDDMEGLGLDEEMSSEDLKENSDEGTASICLGTLQEVYATYS